MLGAVAVVHVEIHNRHARQPVVADQVLGPDRHVVEQAEAHGQIRLGVMARRADRAESPPDAAGLHRVAGGQHAARGQRRSLVAPRADRRLLRPDEGEALLAGQPDQGHVGRLVDQGQLLGRGQRERERVHRGEQTGLLQRLDDHLQPFRALDVPVARYMQQESAVVDPAEFHRCLQSRGGGRE